MADQGNPTSNQPKVSSGGGWNPADPTSPDIIDKGKFAVKTYNEQSGSHLEFVTVTQAEEEIVKDGINYHLTVSARGGLDNASHLYSGGVFEAKDKVLEFQYFKKIN